MGLQIVLAATIASASLQLPAEYEIDFRKAAVLPPLFEYPAKSMWLDDVGLRVNLPADRQDLGARAFASKFLLSGDFEITAAYRIDKLEEPSAGAGVGLSLKIETTGAGRSFALLGRTLRPSGEHVLQWTIAKSLSPGDSKVSKGDLPYQNMAGLLRIERKAGLLRFFGSENEENKFRLLSENEFGNDDVQRIILQATTAWQKKELDCHWLSLHVKADEILSSPKPPASSFSYVITLAIGGAGAILLFIGWFLRRQKGRRANKKVAATFRLRSSAG